MIISRTPFRISFFGGGTDYPAWYLKHGGAVLATTINKYCYLNCRFLPPFFEHRYRIVYSKLESAMNLDEIQHPSVRECLRYLQFERGVEIHHDADIPARSGMGSSSAFTVGLLNSLHALRGTMVTKRDLASQSIHVEQNLIKENVGSQDQISATYGGLNHIIFLSNGEFSVRRLTLAQERLQSLEDHLMLFYTGIKRTASDVASSFLGDLDSRRRQLRIMKDLVEESIGILTSKESLISFGELMHEAWQTKRTLSNIVSNNEVDTLYEKACEAGAVGGKLVGAGGGGFMLMFVPPKQQEQVRLALKELIHVPFRFDTTGSQIIFYEPGEDYSKVEQERMQNEQPTFRELALEQSPV